MPQIFTPSADTRLRAAALVVGIGGIGSFLLGGGYVNSAYVTRVGWPPHQPVPFSHQHHVGDDGIDCRYCHDKVEVSSQAGLPPTHTCMTCHSQLFTGSPILEPVRRSLSSGVPIHWNRVAKVPDFVFFNHAKHAKTECATCHGQVQQRDILMKEVSTSMNACVNCHVHQKASTACHVCHELGQ